jgi:hypothetical protein
MQRDVQHDRVLIHGALEINQNVSDPNEHLIEVPCVSGLWSAAAQPFGKLVTGTLPLLLAKCDRSVFIWHIIRSSNARRRNVCPLQHVDRPNQHRNQNTEHAHLDHRCPE